MTRLLAFLLLAASPLAAATIGLSAATIDSPATAGAFSPAPVQFQVLQAGMFTLVGHKDAESETCTVVDPSQYYWCRGNFLGWVQVEGGSGWGANVALSWSYLMGTGHVDNYAGYNTGGCGFGGDIFNGICKTYLGTGTYTMSAFVSNGMSLDNATGTATGAYSGTITGDLALIGDSVATPGGEPVTAPEPAVVLLAVPALLLMAIQRRQPASGR